MAHQFLELANLDTDVGNLPVSLAEIKSCLKLESGPSPDDDFLTLLLNASTQDVEKYLGRRVIRANTWTLHLDEFCDRIRLNRDPVDSITSVDRLVVDVWTAVTSSDYYLKRSQQYAEVLLVDNAEWPDDQDEVEAAVRVVFLTKPHACTDMAKAAIKRHVTFMYENRGDCDPEDSESSFEASGARGALARLRIQKV